MKFSEADVGDGHRIQGYEPGRIVIDGESHRAGLILTPDRIIPGWGPEDPEGLSEDDIAALVELSPQVIVIGTGRRQVFPAPAVYAAAMRCGVGVEIMDTGAACRTYNIVMAEGRRIVAGLMIGPVAAAGA
jgi:uncharacterized protein